MGTARHTVAGGYEISISERGDGPDVVLIHGSGPGASGASNFRGNIDVLADAGYHVLAPDLIGYGASSKPSDLDYTLDLFTDTLYEALLKAGVRRAHLVGNSLGGAIAIRIALAHPEMVDKLVLMAPGGIESRETYFAMPGIARMVGDFTSPDFDLADMRRLVSNLVYDPAQIEDRLVEERFAVARTQPKDVLYRMRVPDLSDSLDALTMPILGFWGVNDDFCPASGAQKFLSACPDVRFLLFARTGHWVMVERRDEFNRHVLDFLAH